MIGVIDVGLGNIGSLLNMLDRVGAPARPVATVEALATARALILPGVGAFDHGMRRLQNSGLIPALEEQVLAKNTPLLGICLGMQLLGHGSEEGLPSAGLGLVPATTRRIAFASLTQPLRLPHMGWNDCKPVRGAVLLPNDGEIPRFYFVHSYHVVPNTSEIAAGWTHYGNDFVSAIQHRNIYGVQFHPEKSHRWGKDLLTRFANLVR